MTGVPFPSARRAALRWALIVAAAIAAVVAAVAVVHPRIEDGLLRQAHGDDAATLALVAEAIDQLVRRFDPVPELVAERPHLRAALADPTSTQQTLFASEQLRLTRRSVGASDIFLVGRDGVVIAAGAYRDADHAIGRDVARRPYFRAAMRGRASFFHAGGAEGDGSDLYFSAPVLDGIEVVGVLAVRIDMGAVVESWRDHHGEIAVADANGVLFLSSRPDWTLRSLAPLTDAARHDIAVAHQFPLSRIAPLKATLSPLSGGVVRIGIGAGGGVDDYLVASTPLALPGWHAMVLRPWDPVAHQALRILMGWGAVALTALLLAAAIVQRVLHHRDRVRAEQRERDRLETRVAERTAQLAHSNDRLRREVAERRRAEARLERTQEKLVQAGKLAALGKMSAALSHEINQPLAAIKSYASNASTFLDRDRLDEARENVRRISRMTDRVARISRHLLNFARRPGEALVPVELGHVVRETLELMEPEFRARGVAVRFDAPQAPLWAMGGEVRLQQVLINLLNNAVAAMEDVDAPRIDVAVEHDATEGASTIAVRDCGPGIEPAMVGQLFEPFQSGRADGRGLGLGLSISYNIVEDFGGAISAHARDGGGAEFRVRLPAIAAPRAGAA